MSQNTRFYSTFTFLLKSQQMHHFAAKSNVLPNMLITLGMYQNQEKKPVSFITESTSTFYHIHGCDRAVSNIFLIWSNKNEADVQQCCQSSEISRVAWTCKCATTCILALNTFRLQTDSDPTFRRKLHYEQQISFPSRKLSSESISRMSVWKTVNAPTHGFKKWSNGQSFFSHKQ